MDVMTLCDVVQMRRHAILDCTACNCNNTGRINGNILTRLFPHFRPVRYALAGEAKVQRHGALIWLHRRNDTKQLSSDAPVCSASPFRCQAAAVVVPVSLCNA